MSPSLETKRFAAVASLLLWCSLLIALRIHRTGDQLFAFLWWNLFLAVIPLFASSAMKSVAVRGQPILLFAYSAVWLLFLPNAPYILTDLIHLTPRPPVPLWYDLTLLLSCAGTGLFPGYLSVADVHALAEQRFGKKTGWLVAVTSLLLCGFGIYLGRFLRWNSWEALTHPVDLLSDISGRLLNPDSNPHPLVFTLVFGIALILGYVALRVAAAPITAADATPKAQQVE